MRRDSSPFRAETQTRPENTKQEAAKLARELSRSQEAGTAESARCRELELALTGANEARAALEADLRNLRRSSEETTAAAMEHERAQSQLRLEVVSLESEKRQRELELADARDADLSVLKENLRRAEAELASSKATAELDAKQKSDQLADAVGRIAALQALMEQRDDEAKATAQTLLEARANMEAIEQELTAARDAARARDASAQSLLAKLPHQVSGFRNCLQADRPVGELTRGGYLSAS